MVKGSDLRILVVNPFGIGDVLFSTPVLSRLRKNFPSAFITYICNERTQSILKTNPHIDKVLVFEKDEYRNLWRRSKMQFLLRFRALLSEIKASDFSVLLDMSLGHQYSACGGLIGIKKRIGFNYKNRGRFLTHKLDFTGFCDKSIAEYYLELLSFLGIEEKKTIRTEFYLTREDEKFADNFFKSLRFQKEEGLIGIAPGGGVSFGSKMLDYKRWPKRHFAKLSNKLLDERLADVLILWGPKERELAEEIHRMCSKRTRLAPPTTIRQMAALMKRCRLIVSNDGGPLHIAVACGVPTVSIFGPADERAYGPYPASEIHAVVTKQLECRPCYKRFKVAQCDHKNCLNLVSPDEVFDIIKNQLKPSAFSGRPSAKTERV